MKREIITTADGSSTIYLPEWNEHYHSKHGAIQEALHVFIKMGLHRLLEEIPKKEISILEVGFGTGLNAFITYLETERNMLKVNYTGVEAYPVSMEELERLNYSTSSFEANIHSERDPEYIFELLHKAQWEKKEVISSFFTLLKRKCFFSEIDEKEQYELIYFDAFGPRVQPDLWTEEIFSSMHRALKSSGSLVTYSAKGSVRRAMEAVGFQVERLPGPPGKREMLRAVKKI